MRDARLRGVAVLMRARRGTSLFEAVIALSIVAITAISALEAAAGEMRTAVRARRATEASALATERVAFLSLLTDRDFQSLPDSVAHGQFDWPLDEYTWTTTATTDAAVPGLYDFTVTITWADGTYAVNTAQYRRPALATRGQ